jgi:hypothetical protein
MRVRFRVSLADLKRSSRQLLTRLPDEAEVAVTKFGGNAFEWRVTAGSIIPNRESCWEERFANARIPLILSRGCFQPERAPWTPTAASTRASK